MRSSPKQQTTPLPPNSALKEKSSHRSNVSACSSMVSWADPNEVCQMLDYFTATPTRVPFQAPSQASTPKINSYEAASSLRSWSFDYDRPMDQKRPVMVHNSASLISPKSREVRASPSPRKGVPLKAQRLMGLDSPVYHKSTFDDWEDEENRQSRLGSPLVRRPKGDSKIFFRTPTRSTSYLGDTSMTSTPTPTSGFPSPSIGDDNVLAIPNRDSPGSKWSTLGQRFRSNTTAPVAMRLRRKDSSPTSSSFFAFDKQQDKEDVVVMKEAPPISRTASMIETPTATSFALELHHELSNEDKNSRLETRRSSNPSLEKGEWAEARASSRALNNLVDPVCRESKISAPIRQWKTQFSNDSNSSIEHAISSVYSSDAETQPHSIRATPPLRFNPTRRPRAPFPPADQLDDTSKVGINNQQVKEENQPLSPPLPPCPDKMQMPSRFMRPSPTSVLKEVKPPHRPRRPTESNIFAKSYQESTVSVSVLSTKSTRKSSAPPPQRPPPAIPIPPVPSSLSTLEVKQSVDHGLSISTEDKRKTKGLMTALGMQTPSPLPTPSPSKEVMTQCDEQNNAGSDHTPSRFVFRGEDTDVPFSASLIDVGRGKASDKLQVELIVGGVSFETQSLLLQGSASNNEDGLASWLQEIIEERKTVGASNGSNTLTVPMLSQPIKSVDRNSSKSLYSYDSGSFISPVLESSSSEEESEEEYQPAFTYQMSPLAHPQWTVEEQDDETMEKLLSPIQTLQLASPLQRRAHARTPTSVSSDNDSNEGDESLDSGSSRNQFGETPDLVASKHAFIFTTSSPPMTQHPSKSTNEQMTITSLKVKLDRDPQIYPIILHLLKHGTFPDYFSLDCIPIKERYRSIQALSRECQWLGYDNLVSLCDRFSLV